MKRFLAFPLCLMMLVAVSSCGNTDTRTTLKNSVRIVNLLYPQPLEGTDLTIENVELTDDMYVYNYSSASDDLSEYDGDDAYKQILVKADFYVVDDNDIWELFDELKSVDMGIRRTFTSKVTGEKVVQEISPADLKAWNYRNKHAMAEEILIWNVDLQQASLPEMMDEATINTAVFLTDSCYVSEYTVLEDVCDWNQMIADNIESTVHLVADLDGTENEIVEKMVSDANRFFRVVYIGNTNKRTLIVDYKPLTHEIIGYGVE